MSERLTVGVAARLSRYLQVLTQAKKMGRSSISSQDVSEYTHINATQIRRDLSAFGKFGKRGVGYNIDALIAEIRGILRTSGQHNIALVGAGRLGQAIAGSSIFADHGFHIVTIFDDDPAKIGTELGGVAIRSTATSRRRWPSTTSSPPSSPCPRAPRRASPISSCRPACTSSSTTPRRSCRRPRDVVVHSSSPAVELLHALYFYLT